MDFLPFSIFSNSWLTEIYHLRKETLKICPHFLSKYIWSSFLFIIILHFLIFLLFCKEMFHFSSRDIPHLMCYIKFLFLWDFIWVFPKRNFSVTIHQYVLPFSYLFPYFYLPIFPFFLLDSTFFSLLPMI